MKRVVDNLAGPTFDLLVIGGGIYGLTIAYDAALRGLAVALIERDDFGSGASFNHLRTIHGGLRYLQTLDVGRARESVRERRTLALIASEGVRPLGFVLPLTNALARGKTAMRAGFLLDRLVAFDRNRDLGREHQLPAGAVISRAEAIARFPELNRQHLTGAAVWYDYVMVEADRLTFAFARAADSCGATLANHVEATALLVDGKRVVGTRAVDVPSGRHFEISARITVNATGGAVDRLVAPVLPLPITPLLKAMNVVSSRPAREMALGGRAPSGRNLFMVPWRGRALFGTWESTRTSDAVDTCVSEGEVVGFLEELNQTFLGLDLTLSDITLVHRGLVPARVGSDGHLALQRDEHVRDHAADGLEGLVSVAGSKYTTARAAAERLVDRLLGKLQRAAVPCRTGVTPLPPIAGGELVQAVRHEMAITLADAVIRRTALGALGYPGDVEVERAAGVVAGELGWTTEQTRAEVNTVRSFYRWDLSNSARAAQ